MNILKKASIASAITIISFSVFADSSESNMPNPNAPSYTIDNLNFKQDGQNMMIVTVKKYSYGNPSKQISTISCDGTSIPTSAFAYIDFTDPQANQLMAIAQSAYMTGQKITLSGTDVDVDLASIKIPACKISQIIVNKNP